MSLRVVPYSGADLDPLLDGLARLRITVFAEYPYLYDGDLDYERWYLEKFAAIDGAVIVAALDGEQLVGMSTGSPLAHQFEDFSAPLKNAGYDIQRFFYCGECLLLGSYRGRGVGHQFFDHREAQARQLGLSHCCFLSVIRDENDPRKPEGYRTLHSFWRKRGYQPIEGLTAQFAWREHGAPEERVNQLSYWMRAL